MILFFTWYYFIIVAIYLGIRLTTFKKDRFRMKKVALEVIFLVYCTAIVDLTLFPIEYAVPDTPLPPEVEAELEKNEKKSLQPHPLCFYRTATLSFEF